MMFVSLTLQVAVNGFELIRYLLLNLACGKKAQLY